MADFTVGNPSSQIVTQDSDIELFLTLDIDPQESLITSNITGQSVATSIRTASSPTASWTNSSLFPGDSYRISVRDMVNNGINVAVQSYQETTKSRISVQHTEQGIYIDPYKTAPTMLTITFAAEMPQAALTKINFRSNSLFNAKISQASLLKAAGQISAQAALGAVAAISPSLSAELKTTFALLSAVKQNPQSYKSFTEMMDAIIMATAQKFFPNIANLFYLDFGRNVFQKISILNVSQKASTDPLNIIFYTLTCVVLSSRTVPTSPALPKHGGANNFPLFGAII